MHLDAEKITPTSAPQWPNSSGTLGTKAPKGLALVPRKKLDKLPRRSKHRLALVLEQRGFEILRQTLVTRGDDGILEGPITEIGGHLLGECSFEAQQSVEGRALGRLGF